MTDTKSYAIVAEDNTVINVIVWDGTSLYSPGEGLTLIQSDTAGRGDTYDPQTGNFTRKEIPNE